MTVVWGLIFTILISWAASEFCLEVVEPSIEQTNEKKNIVFVECFIYFAFPIFHTKKNFDVSGRKGSTRLLYGKKLASSQDKLAWGVSGYILLNQRWTVLYFHLLLNVVPRLQAVWSHTTDPQGIFWDPMPQRTPKTRTSCQAFFSQIDQICNWFIHYFRIQVLRMLDVWCHLECDNGFSTFPSDLESWPTAGHILEKKPSQDQEGVAHLFPA